MGYEYRLTWLIEADSEKEAIEELKNNIECGIGASDFELIKDDTNEKN
jgi:hypothetical protein